MFKNGTDTAAVGICPVFYLWIRKLREDISLYFFGIDFQQVLTGQIQSICYTKGRIFRNYSESCGFERLYF